MQRFFADPASHAHLPALPAVLPNILRLVRVFHDAGRPVVLTRQGSEPDAPTLMQRWWRDELGRGEERARLIEPLAEGPHDLVLDKSRYSAFAGTELSEWLSTRGCDVVVVTGVMTHLCCETTARDAFMRDLAPVVVADACATQDEELHVGALRGLCHGFAVVSSTSRVLSTLGGESVEDASGSPEVNEAPGDAVALAIVGAGPAGLAAAVQARRAGVELCLLDPAGRVGGQASTADWIENYPGFPGGVDGGRLVDRFAAQALEQGVSVIPRTVEAVDRGGGGLRLRLEGGGSIRAGAVILATGSAPKELGLPVPAGAPVVSRTDALPRLRGARVLVVGGGEAALDQALRARRLGAAEVCVAVRSSAPRAMELLLRRARQREVRLLTGTVLDGLRRADGTWYARLEPGGERPVDAVVVCVGKQARLPGLPDGVALDRAGLPVVDRVGRTALVGLYVVGDASRGRYRQVAIATGDGVAAAMHAVRFLQTGRWEETS